jgi:uncharacterized damage-inducible protein DinB
MIPKNNFELMARYNQWMNEKLYQVCAGIPDQERKKDLGAFFTSVHGTLNHLLYGDKAWMNRFVRMPLAVTAIGEELHQEFDRLRADRTALGQQILDWSHALNPRWLNHRSSTPATSTARPAFSPPGCWSYTCSTTKPIIAGK